MISIHKTALLPKVKVSVLFISNVYKSKSVSNAQTVYFVILV